MNYFVGRSLALGELSAVRRYTSSAFVGLSAIAALVFVITTTLVILFQGVLVRNGTSQIEILGGAIGFLLLFCIGLPMEMFGPCSWAAAGRIS